RRRVVERRRFGRRVGVDGPRWARLHYAQSGDAMPSHVLAAIRQVAGPRRSEGLSDAAIERFLALDPNLGRALEEAGETHRALRSTMSEVLAGPEDELIAKLQAGYLNFYAADAVNPYVPLAARGPWIVTSHGAVIHDSGGY